MVRHGRDTWWLGTARILCGWACPSAQATELRAKHNLCLQDCDEFAIGPHRAAFLRNGWALAPVFPRGPDLTSEALDSFVADLLAEMRQFAPISVDGCTRVATDGSARNPDEPDFRVASFAVAWMTEDGVHTWAEEASRVDTTVNCAELTAVVVAASACEQLQLTCVKILSDHEAVVPGIAGPKTRDAKFVLWKRLASVLHRSRFEIAWVPGHGRARHRHVPEFWRLNTAADHAAEDASTHSLARTAAWASLFV